MRAMVWSGRVPGYLALVAVAASLGGCKSVSERYIALEVWKYEKCFGHLPPGFVPPGTVPAAAPMAAAAPPMQPCGQGAACPPAPCGGEAMGGMAGNCGGCQGGIVEGGLPAGAIMSPGVPSGPGGSPGAGIPTPAAITSSRPVVISDEVVLP